MSEWLVDRPTGEPRARFLFAHGAGAPMDSDFMSALAGTVSAQGIEVVRFEFPYMQERRQSGKRRPPNPMPQLQKAFAAQIDHWLSQEDGLPLFIGGKSMGGRVASLLADARFAAGQLYGLVCLGYPFHPRGKPERLRTEHLADLQCPALVVQGTRDPLGNAEEVAGYGLSESISVVWLEDGDHDFKPRKASGFTLEGHWQAAAKHVAEFIQKQLRGS
ncbi:Alpha/beta hydrolase family protein [Microbulbifer aggregans]|uniref:Alpha/beta hydrolase family protein n=1 Tax=Microbulbifer aggregans TaxID=1769779 RepID=A0A1C9W8R3_9GAMM|nr:alpha/beta family hydrolase [Microbulbifer aggregans]AOS97544.1 Alpha/beta hydrolase family protein [Microbulbifer aggregans]